MKTRGLLNKIIGLFNLKLVRKKRKKDTVKLDRREIIDEVEDLLARINLQQQKIVEQNTTILKNLENKLPNRGMNLMSHEADYYFVLSRRAYRIMELLQQRESSVANLKGKNSNLLSKLAIRDLSEHWEGWDKFPPMSPNSSIKGKNNFTINKDSLVFQSGSLEWDFYKDHTSFIQVLNDVLEIVKQSTTDTYLFEKSRRF